MSDRGMEILCWLVIVIVFVATPFIINWHYGITWAGVIVVLEVIVMGIALLWPVKKRNGNNSDEPPPWDY